MQTLRLVIPLYAILRMPFCTPPRHTPRHTSSSYLLVIPPAHLLVIPSRHTSRHTSSSYLGGRLPWHGRWPGRSGVADFGPGLRRSFRHRFVIGFERFGGSRARRVLSRRTPSGVSSPFLLVMSRHTLGGVLAQDVWWRLFGRLWHPALEEFISS